MSLIPPEHPTEPEPAVVLLRHALIGAAACAALVAALIMSYCEVRFALADQQLTRAQTIAERADAVMSDAEAIRAEAADLCGGDE
jgi:sensor c-di-GMP phosphodiesterase-like protein